MTQEMFSSQRDVSPHPPRHTENHDERTGEDYFLSEDDIRDFQRVYREAYDEDLSDTEAARRASQLLRFFDAICDIVVKEGHIKPASSVDETRHSNTLDGE